MQNIKFIRYGFSLVETFVTKGVKQWTKACSIAHSKGFAMGKGNVLVKRRFADIARIICEIKCGFVTVQASLSKKSVSRCGIGETMSFNNKHYDGNVGCEPCMLKAKLRMHRRNTHRSLKCAFSLVEMLMALLVASLLLAALAPVMTRKFNENVNVSGTGNGIKAPADMQCYPYLDSNSEIKIPLNNVYYANFLMVSGGGGGAGATSSKKVPANPLIQKTNGIVTASKTYDEQIITIDEYMTDVKIEALIGGGGGGGGGAGYIKDCAASYGANFSVSDLNGLCVTKLNHHDGKVNTSTNCWDNYPASYESSDCNSNSSMGYTYSGCRRVVCTYSAASTICNTLGTGWRLPTYNELYKWNSLSQWRRLGLCSAHSTTAVSWCGGGTLIGGTPGEPHWADTHRVWADSSSCPAKAGSYGCTYMVYNGADGKIRGDGHFGTSYEYLNSKHSVRCVIPSYNSFSGAGGGAGSVLANIDLTSYIKQAGIGGRIVIRTGRGGGGATGTNAKNTKANNGTAGGSSYVLVQKKLESGSFQTIKGYYTRGGLAGTGANATSWNNNAVGAISSGTLCRESSDGTNWTDIACSKAGTAGGGGAKTTGATSKGGNGANSHYTSSGGGAGAAANSTTGTGSNAASTAYGAGGGGGTAVFASGDNITADKGGDGAGGYIKITYNNEFAGAGGGGGGGGTVVQVNNLYIGKNAECTLKIGNGGSGGDVNNKGYNGENSSVKCSTDSRTFEVSGGTGGNIGVAAPNKATAPTGGTPGVFGDATPYVYAVDPDKRVIKKGLEGKAGEGVIGGAGGTSGTGTKGACGGLYYEEGICQVNNTDINRITGKGFNYSEVITPTSNELIKSSYGKAGAGGGGGGWVRNLGSGEGGDGMPGYICVFWYGE